MLAILTCGRIASKSAINWQAWNRRESSESGEITAVEQGIVATLAFALVFAGNLANFWQSGWPAIWVCAISKLGSSFWLTLWPTAVFCFCLIGELDLGALQEIVAAEQDEKRGYSAFMVDSSGILLAHPQLDLVALRLDTH